MELPKDWARHLEAYEAEQYWRNAGEAAIRREMERRLQIYFEKKKLKHRPKTIGQWNNKHIRRSDAPKPVEDIRVWRLPDRR